MKDFTEIDCAIMTRIAEGKTQFSDIWPAMERLAQAFDGSTDRVVDRRLQALRKKGLISFNKGRWSLCGSLRAPT